jgi:hypothetical protein
VKELRRILARQPEVALGVAVFAGLALGAGWLPLPSFSLGSILPAAKPAAPATAASSPSSSATAAPAAPSPSMWD